MDHPFRSAALGGFNRQDVLDYLEKMSAENAQRQQELQQKLETAEDAQRQLSAQTAQQEEQLAILRRDRDQLKEQLEQVQQALASSQAQEEAQESALTALRQERDELKARVEVLEPEAAAYETIKDRTAGVELEAHPAYETIKDRTAGVELEAHCRAQNVLDQANVQAKELRRNMEQWLGRVEREYDALRSEVESTVSHAADKLEKAGKCLEQMTALLADQDVALEALSLAYDNTDPAKVPAPVPLNENGD